MNLLSKIILSKFSKKPKILREQKGIDIKSYKDLIKHTCIYNGDI